MELNREQIIKALECCSKTTCEGCPYTPNGKVDIFDISCSVDMTKDALALITSQEQRIFDLEKRLRYLLQSKTIQEYDEVDIHTKEYKKDIHSLDANIEHLNEWNKQLTEENERLREELKQRPPKLIITKVPKKENENV